MGIDARFGGLAALAVVPEPAGEGRAEEFWQLCAYGGRGKVPRGSWWRRRRMKRLGHVGRILAVRIAVPCSLVPVPLLPFSSQFVLTWDAWLRLIDSAISSSGGGSAVGRLLVIVELNGALVARHSQVKWC